MVCCNAQVCQGLLQCRARNYRALVQLSLRFRETLRDGDSCMGLIWSFVSEIASNIFIVVNECISSPSSA